MKVALISPYSEISAIGVRTLSAYLKSHGISTRMIFLPKQKSFYSREDFINYSDTALDNLANIIKNDDLIGISVMTNYYDAVKDLTIRLKRKLPKKTVIWGGIHPTVMPDTCIEIADYVCIGEGELPFLELCQNLADGISAENIPGIWSHSGNSISRNNPCNVVYDLDKIPPQDYDLEDNYILLPSDRLIPLTENNIRKYLGVTYWTLYTRGCPFNCAYCCNNALRRINRDFTRLRAKSPDTIIREIQDVKKRFPFIQYVYFADDTMFALSEKDIKVFSEKYKKFINLPFVVSGVQPSVFTEKKFDYLVDCGLIRVRMGIQTGSQNVLDMYKRKQSNDTIIKVTKMLQKHSKTLMMPNYDIILDNPWEKREDTLQTIALLKDISPPYCLNLFSLVFFPGTSLYDKALHEKIISNNSAFKHYHNYKPTYLNLVIALFCLFKVPNWLLKLLLSEKLVKTKQNFRILHRLLFYLIFIRRGIYSIFKRDFAMFPPRMQLIFCRLLPPRSEQIK
jgi:radical SAM superfamily enzyme YgiQ (UPF0313 family)